MGGVDKAALVVGGVRLLDRVLAAARPVCDRLVVVGPARPTTVDGVTFVTEAEPGGGPVPAVAAGLEALGPGCDVVIVLAADLPLLETTHLHVLLAPLAAPTVEAAAAADQQGPNALLAAYHAGPLAARIGSLGPGDAASQLLPPPAATAVVDLGSATLNVNRPEDLDAAEHQLNLRP